MGESLKISDNLVRAQAGRRHANHAAAVPSTNDGRYSAHL